ncbi:YcjF family protein [Salinibacterium sp. NK8237]|uniref:YcjF family protein n=1 Tax=Salinibacterium sp. NK8237 TaxID=2792038 RepID=UPI0018CF5C51|nr:GTPase [Salinibacterium sp. NK8237]MBH0128784.1 50S ribosome-binding GTPase [Salinibacterium sp. NK8237]
MRDQDDLQSAIEGEVPVERANIALFGATGAGKSTLLNAIFGAEIAQTGIGAPVTNETEMFVNDAGTLAIFDGAGVELGGRNPVRDITQRLFRNRQGESDAVIHVAWYCVNSQTGRLEKGQRDVITKVAALGIPVVLVLTKANVRNGVVEPKTASLADEISKMTLPIVGGRPVITSSVDDEFNGVGRFGLETLLDETYRVVPEAQKISVAGAQKIDLTIKARYARSWIAGAVAFAGGVGATPIPLADAALLIPAQAALMARIAAIYDIPQAKAAKLVGSTTVLAAGAGKIAAASLLKLIPGVGSVISAGVAATLTGVLGESWRVTTERVFTGKFDLDDADQLTKIAEMFASNMKSGAKAEAAPAATD